MEFEFSSRMANMKPSVIREILKQMSDPSLISFAGGNPAAISFPSDEIAEISQSLLKKDSTGILQYSVSEGLIQMRSAAKAFANKKGDIVKQNDDVLIVSGSQQAIEFTVKCLCNEGDTIAVEEPAFIGAYNTFRSYGAVLRGVGLESDGVNLQELEKALCTSPRPKLFYCIPNFQNPTGAVTSEEKRKAIYALCVKYGVPILEDDPYGEIRISGEEIAPIKALDTVGAVIYAASFSKILSPGMRVAYCACNKALFAKMVVAKQCCDVHTAVWPQAVCAEFLTAYNVDEHLKRLRKIYSDKAQLMVSALHKSCPELIFSPPKGGMFIWAQLPSGVDMQSYVKKCLEKRLALIPGNVFYTNEETKTSCVRINYSAPSEESILKGTQIMGEVLHSV